MLIDLNEEVYMQIPPGLQTSHPNLVFKLHKSLYGLKQASRQCFTVLLIYVDDIVILGDCLEEINRVKSYLDNRFKIKDSGNLRYFLGLEVARSKSGIIVNQRKYTLELISDARLLDAKSVSTLMDSLCKLSCTQGTILNNAATYRRLIGRLLYLTTTRPNISFTVQQLSQFVSCPSDIHMAAAVRVLKYLKGSPTTGLFFSANTNLHVSGFADVDWACCPDTRKSISGYCAFIGSSLVAWKAKKQSTISRSSSEAEYRALASLSCELQWLQYLFTDLRIPWNKPVLVFCDNRSAIYLAHNPAFHERSKHIEIDFHVKREKILSSLIRLLPSYQHYASILWGVLQKKEEEGNDVVVVSDKVDKQSEVANVDRKGAVADVY
ncbi:uncharacterized mitochondrial protein AtMg00810-like [Gastrolobium bilobum]|uniref:uncharacterized mitochondrial protein AtMg00810-like n=1 Tax=Gastrolobium bilobum TaxID=150636 RepID=UPI002AB0DC33|nr:uncharacterized mitochondrial protein AtMg00810-like [Gastrolobium bilobum]